MNKNRFYLLILLLLVTGILLFVMSKRTTSTIDGSWADFSIGDTAQITKVFLTDKSDHRILLERIDNGSWKVNGQFKARQDVVQNLLGTIKLQRLRAPVPKSMFNNVVAKIAGTHTKVEVYLNHSATPEKVFFVGGSTQDQSGTFMLLDGADQPAVIHIEGHYGFLGPRYSVNLNVWKSTEIFNYPGERLKEIVSIELKNFLYPNASFKIEMTGNQPFLYASNGQKVEPADPGKLYDYIRRYSKIHFEGWEETKTVGFRDSILRNAPIEEYIVTEKSGRVVRVKTFLKPAPPEGTDYEDNPITHDLDRMYGLVNDTDFVLLQYYVFDPLNVELSWFKSEAIVNK